MKKAVILSYHSLKSKRIGGIHHFLKVLSKKNYTVDFITVDYYLHGLLLFNDRYSIKNLISLLCGYKYNGEYGKAINKVLISLYMPNFFNKLLGDKLFSKLAKINIIIPETGDKYDICILESSTYLSNPFIESIIKKSKYIIYRPSDPVILWNKNKFFVDAEKEVINIADKTLIPFKSYYDKLNEYGMINEKCEILNNPIPFDIKKKCTNPYKTIGNVFYIGAFKIDYNLLKYCAMTNKDLNFYIAGPYKPINVKNIHFLSTMSAFEAYDYIKYADIFIIPYKRVNAMNDVLEITGKIMLFMKEQKPIIAINVSKNITNYGIIRAKNSNEFSKMIKYNINKKACYDLSILDEYCIDKFYEKAEEHLFNV